jgi:hypothetical protein
MRKFKEVMSHCVPTVQHGIGSVAPREDLRQPDAQDLLQQQGPHDGGHDLWRLGPL